MGYPQPDANLYSTGGQGFFRLKTTLRSDGDIYESEQSSHGFAIGPDSDLSLISIAYFDPQNAQRQQQVVVSPDRPFPGFVQAGNQEGLFAPSSRPGRIIMWPGQNFNVDFRTGDFDPGQWRMDFEMPVFDIIEYFAPGPATPSRNNKTYNYQKIPFPNPTGGFWGLVIPYYGRKYASIYFDNEPPNGENVTIKVSGINYMQGPSTAAGSEEQLLAPTVVAASAHLKKIIRSSVDGMYDALLIRFSSADFANPPNATNTAACLIRITVSDHEV